MNRMPQHPLEGTSGGTSRRRLTLSVLDIGPVRTNQSASDWAAGTIKLARHAECLGYRRFWLAEHHNVRAVAASHTSVMSAALGVNTTRIRIGGCVLLPHYPPFLVAEQFALLESLNPGRVDLGIGRSTGADFVATTFLRGQHGDGRTDAHPQAISSLVSMLRPEGVEIAVDDEEYRLHSGPRADTTPTMWILGTSAHSARLAAQFGLPYAFGYHITGAGVREALDIYRSEFVPSAACPAPKVLLSLIAVVAETAREAERLARSQLYFMSAFRLGEPVQPQMLVEDAEETSFPDRYDGMVDLFRKTWVIGDAEGAAAAIASLADELGLDEVMINPVAASYRSDDPAECANRELTLTLLAQRLEHVGRPDGGLCETQSAPAGSG